MEERARAIKFFNQNRKPKMAFDISTSENLFIEKKFRNIDVLNALLGM